MKKQTVTISAQRLRAHRLTGEAEEWMEKVGRLSYVARGVVYLLVGWLAIASARGLTAGRYLDVLDVQLGRWTLLVLALGLFTSGVWCFIACLFDPDREGGGRRGWTRRAGQGVNGLIHAVLTIGMLRLAAGAYPWTGGARIGSASLLAVRHHRWALGVAGALVLLCAASEFYVGCRQGFKRRIRLHELAPRPRRWAIRTGMIGVTTRGLVLAILSGLLIWRSLGMMADEVAGIGEPLRLLGSRPWGPYLLGTMGLGLMVYGAHQFVNARYRHIG